MEMVNYMSCVLTNFGRPHSRAENRAPSRGKQDSKQQVSQDQTDGRVVGEKTEEI